MITACAREANDVKLRYVDSILNRKQQTPGRLRCITINTHRGRGPKLAYLLKNARPSDRERLELLHETRTYAYFISDWLNRRREEFDAVALQEVFRGILGVGDRILGKFRQSDHYRVLAGFGSFLEHGVGFAAFRYQNLLLSHLPLLAKGGYHSHLPGRVLGLASCGYTLSPFLFHGNVVWIGNTHLHAYNPRAREKQALRIANEIRKLGNAPIVFLGDMNTVPSGCRVSGFDAGERDENSYRNDGSLGILRDAGLNLIEHRDDESFHTYPTGNPNRTLDYIMFSRHWDVVDYRVVRDFNFSDHYPVYAELDLVTG